VPRLYSIRHTIATFDSGAARGVVIVNTHGLLLRSRQWFGRGCGRDRLVSFSCKGRAFCPSRRRMAERAGFNP
jgi:hypothetical protein